MPQIQELSIPLEELNGQTLDLSHISSKRFRFINIHSFIEHNVLDLVSLDDDISLVEYAYATISYPWQGLELENNAVLPLGKFTVKGAEAGGFVSSDVLMTSCRAAYQLVRRGCKRPGLLWLDRLCIKQEDKEDKNWQIKNMYNIYKGCAICLVLPGGIKRLVELEERTTWAQRAWTLQEALVPHHVECLISWKKPSTVGGCNCELIKVVEPFHSGALSLDGLLNGVMTGLKYMFQKSRDSDRPGFQLDAEKEQEGEQDSVKVEDKDMKQSDKYESYRPKTLSRTEAHILWAALTTPGRRDLREAALWKCALMRTSSRPVDMVFSVMGLFGIELDPTSYEKNDREKATLHMAQRILQSGGQATWLGLSFAIEPSPFMSTMPMFPETEVTGGAMIQTPAGRRSIEEMVVKMWSLSGAPTGTIDDDGYLHTRGRAAAIKKKEGSFSAHDIKEYEINGRADRWVVEPGTSDLGAPYYAIVIGKRQPLPSGGMGTYHWADPVVLMIIQRHGKNPDRYDRKSFATVTIKFVENWPELFFRIGGPTVVHS